MLTWKNRPFNKIEYNLETMKILHELNLTDEQLRKTLLFFFPDLYEPDSKWAGEIDLDKDVYNIRFVHTGYGSKLPDYINSDIDLIVNILKQQEIIG